LIKYITTASGFGHCRGGGGRHLISPAVQDLSSHAVGAVTLSQSDRPLWSASKLGRVGGQTPALRSSRNPEDQARIPRCLPIDPVSRPGLFLAALALLIPGRATKSTGSLDEGAYWSFSLSALLRKLPKTTAVLIR
jgi:hypothetical protein